MEVKDRFAFHKSKYFYMLIVLIFFFIGSAILTDFQVSYFSVSELFSIIILFGTFMLFHDRILLFYTLSLGSISILSHLVIRLFYSGDEIILIFYTANICFLTIITISILHSIAESKEVTADTLFAAICGYLMLGLIWSFIYLTIETIYPGSFKPGLITNSLHYAKQNAFYFSFVTMTTTGYGDILPITNIARACSWLEAMTGQVYLAVWIAQLVGLKIVQKH